MGINLLYILRMVVFIGGMKIELLKLKYSEKINEFKWLKIKGYNEVRIRVLFSKVRVHAREVGRMKIFGLNQEEENMSEGQSVMKMKELKTKNKFEKVNDQ